MKKIYSVLAALFITAALSAQCVIDPSQLPATGGGIYPSAAHLPHIVKDSLYDQSIQGAIPDTMSMNFGGFVSASVRVDSVRLDSIGGLPNGINWIKNPNVLPGGGFGCVEFTGTTSDSAGTYPLSPIGKIWAHLSVPLLGINVDTSSYGPLDRLPMFRNYYVVVDSAQLPLSATSTSLNVCFGDTTGGRVTVTAHGGSPVSPYTYLWDNGATTYTRTGLNAGSYSVTVTCGSETVTTTVVVASQSAPVSLTVTSDSSTTGTNGSAAVVAVGGVPPYTYLWNPGGANTDTISGLAPGTYRVTVRDSFNCVTRDTVDVPGIVNTGITSLNQNIPVLTLYPNPANDVMNVVIETTNPLVAARMEAVDATGRIVYSSPLNVTDRATKTLNISQFSQGVYWLQITSGKQMVHKQFVVAH